MYEKVLGKTIDGLVWVLYHTDRILSGLLRKVRQ